jgi:hypothetical protein
MSLRALQDDRGRSLWMMRRKRENWRAAAGGSYSGDAIDSQVI